MRAARGRGVGTPDLAQQAGVRSKCQRQHDRKESGSKHGILATDKGKSCASQKRRGNSRNSDLLKVSRPPDRRTCGISPVSAENPAGPAGRVQRSAARVIADDRRHRLGRDRSWVLDGSPACRLKNELTIESDRCFVLPDTDPLVDPVHALEIARREAKRQEAVDVLAQAAVVARVGRDYD